MQIRTLVLAALLALPGSGALADMFEVDMLDRGESGVMVFEPAFLHVQPGDTVVFVPVHPDHNLGSIEGMIPKDAYPIESTLMGMPMPVTFSEPGLYGLTSLGHFEQGMVALVQVGDDPENLDALTAEVSKLSGPAREHLDALLAQVK